MTPEQRRVAVKQFDDACLRRPSFTSQQAHPDGTRSRSSVPAENSMSLSSVDCGIVTLSQATLDAIWAKALQYVLSQSDIVSAPGGDPHTLTLYPFPHGCRSFSPSFSLATSN